MSAPLPRRAPQAATSFRWKRANVWLGKGIPLLLLVFAWKGWELVLYRISVYSTSAPSPSTGC